MSENSEVIFEVKNVNHRHEPPLFRGSRDEITEWLSQKTESELVTLEIYSVVTDTYYSIESFPWLVKEDVRFPEAKPKFVPQYYVMNPEFEDLLPFGTQIQNGMVVLIESPGLRANPEVHMAPHVMDKSLENNRWCTVSQVTIIGDEVHFVGTYEDGTKRKRVANKNFAWYVKLDSLEKIEREVSVRAERIQNAVKGAMQSACMIESSDDLEEVKIERLREKARQFSRTIEGML